ncbi:hypothetical protein Tco_0322899 [Tanacetum coccineum]
MSEVNDICSLNLPHPNVRWLLTGRQAGNYSSKAVVNEECSKYVTLDKKLIQSSPFYFSDDDHSVDKVTIPSKVCSLDDMEKAGPSVTEKPTNGSLRLEVDFENNDDDMMIDAPSVRDLHQLAEFKADSGKQYLQLTYSARMKVQFIKEVGK